MQKGNEWWREIHTLLTTILSATCYQNVSNNAITKHKTADVGVPKVSKILWLQNGKTINLPANVLKAEGRKHQAWVNQNIWTFSMHTSRRMAVTKNFSGMHTRIILKTTL